MSLVGHLIGVLAGLTDLILHLPTWLVVGLVFLVPALEASAFVGFLFPGEIAVILGGVVAYQGRAPLWSVIVAAVLGAIIGDSLGYFIGRRWGDRLLKGTIGRLPIIREHIDEHLEAARAYVRRRKGTAVFFGRFTAALRVLVPGLAGMSDVHYPSFLLYNMLGGALWGTGFAVLGYLAGASYKHVASIAGRVGLVLLVLIVLGLALSRLLRTLQARSARLSALADRLAALPPLAWVRRRYPRQLTWLRARLDINHPQGFTLTLAVAVGALALWTFGGLTQDVLGHDEVARVDPRVLNWVLAHRVDWVSSFMSAVSWLGSTFVIVPVLVLMVLFLIFRHRDRRSALLLALSVAGATGLYNVVKLAVGRPRPPMGAWVGHYSGGSFPSGHAAQSIAFYGMLAILFSARRSARFRAVLWAAATLIVLMVGVSRIYLGAHWFSDVLGGWALGMAWLSILLVIHLLNRRGGGGRIRSTDSGDERASSNRRPHRKAA
jgi:membrane protein DedA with SNARE-associated domain/membrane-associated phospholipid phosphatase